MTNEEIRLDVVRQALIEYLAHRNCANLNYPPSEWDIANGLRNYVNRRYASQSERFKTDKMVWLAPRIRAVYDMLEENKDG